MSNTRKLATILFADITGYTSMMQQNEELALACLDRFKETLEDVTPSFDGEIIQYFGDACLLAFNSSLKGVQCAIELQQKFMVEPQLPVRIGIHLGDVVFSNNNVFGDGVNIASRIESMGVPGSILISKSIRDQIKNKENVRLKSLGTFDFKNIDEPMEIYALVNDHLEIPLRSNMHGKLKSPTSKSYNKPIIIALILAIVIITAFGIYKNTSTEPLANREIKSIAVLPFINEDNDSRLDYLCEGMAENLISSLSDASDIKVISRFSSFPLKDSIRNISSIFKMLNVDAILLGSLQKVNDTILLDAELISSKDQSSLWSSKFRGMSRQLPELEKQLTDGILNSFNKVENDQNLSKAVNPEAYQHYMQGRFLSYSSDKEEQELANEHFYDAIAIDPNYALPYAALANQILGQARFSNSSREAMLREARLALQSAFSIDPNLPEAHQAEANMLFFSEFNWEKARESFKKAVASDPTNASILADYAFFLCAMNQYDEALAIAQQAINYDPISISSMHIIAWVQLYLDPNKAIEHFDKIMELHPNWIWAYIKKAMGEILIEDYDAALKSLALLEQRNTTWNSELIECYLATLYLKCGKEDLAMQQKAKVLDYIEKNGITDPLNIAILHGGTGDLDSMIEWSKACIKEKTVNAALMQLVKDLDLFISDPFHDPRYLNLLDEMNFPKQGEWAGLIP